VKEFHFGMPFGITLAIKADTLAEAIAIDSTYDLEARLTIAGDSEDAQMQVLLPEIPNVSYECLTIAWDDEGAEIPPEQLLEMVEEYRREHCTCEISDGECHYCTSKESAPAQSCD
jgi:hypothetical protein